MKFKNKTVIITGVSIGIEKATALEFAKNGANVCIVDINKEQLDVDEKEIKTLGGEVTSYICDVSCEDAVRKTVADIETKYDKIDILVNNAGVWRFFGAFVNTDSNNWKKILILTFWELCIFHILFCRKCGSW